MFRLVLILGTLLLFTSCQRSYVIVEPVSARKSSYYYLTYTIQYEDGTKDTDEVPVSEEVYYDFLKKNNIKTVKE